MLLKARGLVAGAALGALATLLSVPRAARADALATTATAPPRLAPLGAGLAATAGTSLVAGTLAFTLGIYGHESCGLTGCFRRPDRAARVAGAGLFGAGLGMGAVAAPVLARALDPGNVSAWHHSEPMFRAGIWLTTIGVGLGGAALGAHLQGTAEGGGAASGADFAAVMFAVGGGALLLSGVPLWLVGGARAEAPDERALPPTTPSGRTSTAMVIAGAILAGAGAVGIVSGAVVLGGGEHGGGAYAGLLILGAGGVLMLVGVPLAVVGAQPARSPTAPPAVPSAFEPTVFAGPGTIACRWRF